MSPAADLHQVCLSLVALAGRELAAMSAESAWTRRDLCALMPGIVGPILRAATHVYHGGDEVLDTASLDMLGIVDVACVRLALDPRGGDVALTVSDEGMATLWRAMTGARLPMHNMCRSRGISRAWIGSLQRLLAQQAAGGHRRRGPYGQHQVRRVHGDLAGPHR